MTRPATPLLRRTALSLIAGLSVLPCARAETVRMFDTVPTVEELREVLVPEHAPRTRGIEILGQGGGQKLAASKSKDLIPVSIIGPEGSPLPGPAAMPAPGPASASAQPAAAPAPEMRLAALPQPIPEAKPERHGKAPASAPKAGKPKSQPQPAPEPQSTTNSAEPGAVGLPITFAYDSARMLDESRVLADRIGQLMSSEPLLALVVEGHTDAKGGDGYNLTLSRQRAAAVKAYLVQEYSIDPGRLVTLGKGKSEPVAENPYDGANRRVQFRRAKG